MEKVVILTAAAIILAGIALCIGSIALGALSVLGLMEFSWPGAFAAGILLLVLNFVTK